MGEMEQKVDTFFSNIESDIDSGKKVEHKTGKDMISQCNEDLGNEKQVKLSTDQEKKLDEKIKSYYEQKIMFKGAINKIKKSMARTSKGQRNVNKFVKDSQGYREKKEEELPGFMSESILQSYTQAADQTLEKIKSEITTLLNDFTSKKNLDSDKENKGGCENAR